MSQRTTSEFSQSLNQSAANRAAMIKLFGFIPDSVLKISRGELSRRMFIYQHEETNRSTANARDPSGAGKDATGQRQDDRNAKLREQSAELGQSNIALAGYSGGANRMAASIMPAELVDFFVKYYSAPGETYIDPFMGQGIRMQVAAIRGLAYRGYDASSEFYRFIEAVLEKIEIREEIFLTLGDSRTPDEIPDACGDFTFTSPPYWDIEFYGSEPEQLGRGTYDEFIDGMTRVAKSWRPKYKPNANIVINVGDFRRDGRFYAYSTDIINLFTRAGYVHHDTWIINGLVGGMRKVFGVDSNLQKLPPRCHEYALVFRVNDVEANRRQGGAVT